MAFYNGFLFIIFISFIFLLLILSKTTKYYFRLACYYLFLVIIPSAVIPIALFHIGNPDNLMRVSWLYRLVCLKVFNIEWVLKRTVNEHIEGACVYVCNHQSSIDIQGMMCLWSAFRPCVPVVKRELLFSGPFGIICWLAGAIFVDRVNTEASRKLLNVKVQEMKERKINLWIFPEGTRNDNGTLLPFKKGAFHIAVQAQIPIVPVVFSSYSNFYSTKKRIFNGDSVVVSVLPAVPTTGLTVDDVSKLTETVRNSMIDCFTSGSNKGATVNGAHIKSH